MAIALNVGPGDVIDSYSTLVSETAEWLNRSDLTDRIPGFIRLCEARLNRLLRVPDMETSFALTTSTEDSVLPTDFLQMRFVYLEGSPDRPLRAMSPAALASEFNGTAGVPTAFSLIGRTIRLAPPPAQQVLAQIYYFARVPALSESNSSNWLLDQAPDLYLYGTLLQAAAFIDDPERVNQWKAAYDEVLAEVIGAGARSRWGSSALVPNTVKQVRGARC